MGRRRVWLQHHAPRPERIQQEPPGRRGGISRSSSTPDRTTTATIGPGQCCLWLVLPQALAFVDLGIGLTAARGRSIIRPLGFLETFLVAFRELVAGVRETEKVARRSFHPNDMPMIEATGGQRSR